MMLARLKNLFFRVPEYSPYAAIIGDRTIAYAHGTDDVDAIRNLEAWMESPGFSNKELYREWKKEKKIRRVEYYD